MTFVYRILGNRNLLMFEKLGILHQINIVKNV